jgi:spore germination protein (amino acid permease)
MKQQANMAITAFQLGSGLVGVIVGLGPLFMSRVLTHTIGRDAWLIMLIDSLILLGSSALAVHFSSKFPSSTLVESTEIVFGKWIGRLLAILWIPLGILLAGMTLWYTGQVIRTFILFDTPTPFITIGLLLLAAFAASRGLSVIFRVTEIIFILSFGFFIFFIPPVVEYAHVSFIRPLGATIGWHWFPAILVGLFSFAGFEMVMSFYPFLKPGEKSKMMVQMMLHMGYVGLIFVIAVLTQQLVYPIPYIQKLWLPSIHYVSLVSIPIFERSDLIFILFWFCVFFKSNMVYYFRSVLEIQKLFRFTSPNGLIPLVGMLIYGISLIPVNPRVMETYLRTTMETTVLTFIGIPLIGLLVGKWRNLW